MGLKAFRLLPPSQLTDEAAAAMLISNSGACRVQKGVTIDIRRLIDIGDGFRYFDLPEPIGRIAVGICMGKCCHSSFHYRKPSSIC